MLLIWTVFAMVVFFMPGTDPTIFSNAIGVPTSSGGATFLLFLGAVLLSIPAIALYAFGQVVGDVRIMAGHLAAMRKYYEPKG